MQRKLACCFGLATTLVYAGIIFATPSSASGCTFMAPGNLKPGTGKGAKIYKDWGAQDKIISPIGGGVKTVAKTQVHAPGGDSRSNECAASNFRMPHRDTYCERRGPVPRPKPGAHDCPNVGQERLHEGIDINAGTEKHCYRLREAQKKILNLGPKDNVKIIPLVAVVDGKITHISPRLSPTRKPYWVGLTSTATGIRYNYLHINIDTLLVSKNDIVKKGDTIGYYYDEFDRNGFTPFHLHFEVNIPLDKQTRVNASPYITFIRAIERTTGKPCKLVP